MGGRRSTLVALGLVVAATAATTALAGDGQQVKGARYTFSAVSARERASGGGAFDLGTKTGGRGRISVSARGLRAEARVRTWKLSLLGADATLVLRIQVASSTDRAACPVGTKGVATLRDDAEEAGNDRVRVDFAGSRCKALARTWSAGAGTDRVKVMIEPVYPRVS